MLVGTRVADEQEKQCQHNTYEAPEIYLCVEIWHSSYRSACCYLTGRPHGFTSQVQQACSPCKNCTLFQGFASYSGPCLHIRPHAGLRVADRSRGGTAELCPMCRNV